MGRRSILLMLTLSCPILAMAQAELFPLSNDQEVLRLNGAMHQDQSLHAAIKPYVVADLKGNQLPDSALTINAVNGWSNYILNRDLLHKSGPKAELRINPLINAQVGTGNADDKSFSTAETGIGGILHFNLGEKLTLSGTYMTSRSEFGPYLSNFVSNWEVVPGMGYADRKGEAYRSDWAQGYLSYQPIDALNLQVGYGKNFIGHGYRSLLLSDNAYNNPYARITAKFWKVKYMILYSAHKHIGQSEGAYSDMADKYSTSNYLSLNIGKAWNIGFFQSVIWQGQDSVYNRGFDVNYLNPVVFFRPIEFSLGSPDNVVLGAGLSYLACKKHLIYSQLFIDEFLLDELRADNGWWGNKYGFQLGVKLVDPVGWKGIIARLEYNYVRPYTYTHSTVLQNYGHYNQSLAHPLGANFDEVVAQLDYHKKRWIFSLHTSFARQGRDALLADNYGSNIYKPNSTRPDDYGHHMHQGVFTEILNARVRAGYLLNPKWNLMFEASYAHRRFEDIFGDSTEGLFQLGLRSALYNQYRDF